MELIYVYILIGFIGGITAGMLGLGLAILLWSLIFFSLYVKQIATNWNDFALFQSIDGLLVCAVF